MSNTGKGGRIITGFLLIAVGVLFLIGTMDILDFSIPRIVFSGPFFVLVVGLLLLINSHKKFLGSVLTFIGVLLLLPLMFPWVHIGPGIIFPLLIIGLGIHILFRHRAGVHRHWDRRTMWRRRGREWAREAGDYSNPVWSDDYTVSNDTIDDVAIFGGGHKIINSDNFKGGNITAIFGGSEINLMNCKLAEGDNIIEVICVFGGTTLIVPKEWDVVTNVTPIFGGFSNKIFRNPSIPVDTTRKLIIKGEAIFGGGEIKSY